VLPGLYVGNYRDSKDAVQLDRFNITHIVAIHDSARKIHPVSKTKASQPANHYQVDPRGGPDQVYLSGLPDSEGQPP
jgi:hypothetical protein